MASELHFLNVKEGDCTWIKHANGNNTIIDVFNASIERAKEDAFANAILEYLVANEVKTQGINGNFRQKEYPVNPIEYLQGFNVKSIFRYIQTHPDMDHMGGIKEFFETFSPTNFWDTENKKEIDSFNNSPYSEEDWKFYKRLRDGSESEPKRLTIFSGSNGKYYNRDENDNPGGNGLYLLSPTKELVEESNENDDYNDCSYVILFKAANGHRVIIGGDSHDKAWDYILEKHEVEITNVDLLIAPHHGRDSKRNYDFLDVLKPKLTFFGNANSEHLAYDKWNSRNLEKFTNNQGNCLIAWFHEEFTGIYCTYKKFAEVYCKTKGYETHYNSIVKAYFLRTL
jgi:competence protein ComEC